uniref:Protein sprouty homolog 2 n=1 Tax=Poecilia latipinna TaxID=48699 RepID=A0A3B3TQ27_9TELE
MDSRSQNDSDGGGGRHGVLPSLTGLANMAHDEGRARSWSLQNLDAPSDPGLNCRLRPHTPPVLSLDQIRISGGSNEYTDGPSAAQRSPATQQRKTEMVTSTGSRTNGQQETEEEVSNNLRNLYSSSSVEDSQSSVRTSAGSGSSGQRLLGGPANSYEIIRNQPKRADSEELKPLNPLKKDKHSKRCESCGRCKCSECVQPRALPSCWMCGQRCLCSPDKAVEYGTCVCCLKGIFYHCSNDDEDTCADKPFSCSQSRCCVRWTTIMFCSLLCPCLWCYLPGKGCLAMCQCCYDQVARPGCRCKNPTPTRFNILLL